jgi:ZIP family zinc transporter
MGFNQQTFQRTFQRLIRLGCRKMKNLPVIILFVIAEILGAVFYYKTKDSAKRMLLTSLGLGFAVVVVLLDIIPDATEDFSLGYWICATGFVAMFIVGSFGKRISNYSAAAGFAIHNIAEGIIISTVFGPISPLLTLGAILHKLPEGMVTYSLLEGLKDRTRFVLAALIALLIPIGAIVPISESITKPIMAFSAGVILCVVGKQLIMIIAKNYKTVMNGATGNIQLKLASVVVVGALIGWASCLLA